MQYTRRLCFFACSSQKPEQFNNTDLSLLMEKLLQQNRFEESKQVLKEILDRDALPLTRILKMFLIKAMLKGDVEVFELIGNKLTEVGNDFQLIWCSCSLYRMLKKFNLFCLGQQKDSTIQQPII